MIVKTLMERKERRLEGWAEGSFLKGSEANIGESILLALLRALCLQPGCVV